MAELDIARHLTQWGLRRFTDEDSYYAWQRQSLAGERLRLLQQAAEARRDGEDADQVFYDLAASPDILPVLYSQRYDYYDVVASAIADALAGAQCVLDVGCGVGILTTWYATRFPDVTFVGIDRSLKSIEVARRFALSHRLANVSFYHCEIHPTRYTGDIRHYCRRAGPVSIGIPIPDFPAGVGRPLNVTGMPGNRQDLGRAHGHRVSFGQFIESAGGFGPVRPL